MKKILLIIILIITFSCKQKQCCKAEMEVEVKLSPTVQAIKEYTLNFEWEKRI